MKNVYIVTGTSRGLGQALTRKLLGEDNLLFCISRNPSRGEAETQAENEKRLVHFSFDLTRTAELPALTDRIFDYIKENRISPASFTLINNAGVVEPIKPIEACSGDEITNHVSVNLITPMILTASFIRGTNEYGVERQIMNISSGAGKKPYHGWSAYCTTKAGLDMFTRCVAFDQGETGNPVRVLSVAPGVIDTGMQAQIRSTSAEHFRDVNRFISLKNDAQLYSADDVADVLLKMLADKALRGGDLLDVRTY